MKKAHRRTTGVVPGWALLSTRLVGGLIGYRSELLGFRVRGAEGGVGEIVFMLSVYGFWGVIQGKTVHAYRFLGNRLCWGEFGW